ncbi:ubiquitin-protein ligase E3A-like [Tropilaelaps mercedesae]|uniref:Ubiquitin-protein ligase E3A-like n=1 Tax=Tropilaelaps mercedesae TaxID=418985 RepID=A0A1V9XM72_9ACAR|nr:ubiquitin-protein ligase E3A-like [Tropilaelaps mercedesae]
MTDNRKQEDAVSIDSSRVSSGTPPGAPDEGYAFLTEEAVVHMAQRAKATESFAELIRTLGKIYSDYCSLKQSFQRPPVARSSMVNACSDDLVGPIKEAIRAQTEEEKDIDSSEPPLRRESLTSFGSDLDDVLLEQTVDVEAMAVYQQCAH